MRERFGDGLIDDPARQAVWRELEGLRGSETVRATRRYIATRRDARKRRARWLREWRIAVPATAAAFATLAGFLMLPAGPTVSTLSTRVGEMRRERLADGTIVLLNTDSRVRVTYRDDAREVALLAGQARFDVAHDTARPFRVTAGGLSVTAVGTAFDVVALPSRTAVTLIDGRVWVRAGLPGAPAERQWLRPGQQMAIAGGRITPPHAARLDAALAWQRSYIDLSDMPLDEAIAEVNRYSTTKIVVDAPGLGDARIGGVFKAGDIAAVTDALCAYFDLRIVRRDSETVVLAARRAGRNVRVRSLP